MKKIALAIVLCVSTTGSAAETPVDAFLRMYNSLYQGLSTVAQGSAWVASTDVSDAHEAARTTRSADFGSCELIEMPMSRTLPDARSPSSAPSSTA